MEVIREADRYHIELLPKDIGGLVCKKMCRSVLRSVLNAIDLL